MNITDDKLGKCELDICYARSTVDCFFESGFSETLDRELTDDELEYMQNKYEGELQMEAWESGECRDHN
jgi:hypothetical protein